MALDEFLWLYAGDALDVVDVLGVVGEELAFVLQELDEGVGGGEAGGGGEDVAGDGVEDGRVFFKESDVEDFLGVGKSQVFEFGVQTYVFGAEVGDAEGGAYACSCEDDDVVALVEELDYVVDGIVIR